MEFLAAYWYVFFAIFLLSMIYTINNQINRIIRFLKIDSVDEDEIRDAFFKGIYGLAIGATATVASAVLLIIGVLAKIIY